MQKNVAGTVRGVGGGVWGMPWNPLIKKAVRCFQKNTRLFLYNQRVARITGGSCLGSTACTHILIETPVHLTMSGERFRHTTRVFSHIQRNKVRALATLMILVKFVSTSLFLICLILHNLSVFLFTYKASI